jgi:hypothetical protein
MTILSITQTGLRLLPFGKKLCWLHHRWTYSYIRETKAFSAPVYTFLEAQFMALLERTVIMVPLLLVRAVLSTGHSATPPSEVVITHASVGMTARRRTMRMRATENLPAA